MSKIHVQNQFLLFFQMLKEVRRGRPRRADERGEASHEGPGAQARGPPVKGGRAASLETKESLVFFRGLKTQQLFSVENTLFSFENATSGCEHALPANMFMCKSRKYSSS